MEYKIIPAAQADWQKFKEIRLEALRLEGKAFGASYEEQVQEPDERWQTGLARTEKPLFFIEHDGKYIGMAGAKQTDEKVFMIIAVYLKKEYRGLLRNHMKKNCKSLNTNS